LTLSVVINKRDSWHYRGELCNANVRPSSRHLGNAVNGEIPRLYSVIKRPELTHNIMVTVGKHVPRPVTGDKMTANSFNACDFRPMTSAASPTVAMVTVGVFRMAAGLCLPVVSVSTNGNADHPYRYYCRCCSDGCLNKTMAPMTTTICRRERRPTPVAYVTGRSLVFPNSGGDVMAPKAAATMAKLKCDD